MIFASLCINPLKEHMNLTQNPMMIVIVQATTTLDLYRVGADIELGFDWWWDTHSDVEDDDDKDKTYNEPRPGSSKRGEGRDGGSQTNWRSRPVDQLCARTLQVGWLHVSLKCQQMHDRAQRTSCMRTLAHMREGVRMRARTSKRHAHKQLF